MADTTAPEVTAADRKAVSGLRFRKAGFGPGWQMSAVAFVVLLSGFGAVMAKPAFGQAAAALIFVLGVVTAGAIGGLVSALIAAAAAFLLYNFYLAEPVLSFRIASGRDIVPFLVFTLCALVSGVLAGRLKDHASAAKHSNWQLASLLDISRSLQSAVRITDIASALSAGLPPGTSMTVSLFLVRDGSFANATRIPDRPGAAALIRNMQTNGTEPQRDGTCIAYRLDSSDGFEGVILFEAGAAPEPDNAFMSALASLVALAVERAALSESNAEAKAQTRTEELKTALLSSVSHDFRTPLTAISASASSLIDFREQLDGEATIRLLRRIVNECERLNRYTSNLLEMSRLEAGQSLARRQTLEVAETLSVIIQRVRPRAGHRMIERRLGEEHLLVSVDAAMFELVIINLLDNAILYSEDGTRIGVEARHSGDSCIISISDEGCGIPQADLENVFTRFYRVPRSEPSPRGSGLGLAIAKGFVEALGGRIMADSPGPSGRGTMITISLPLAQEARQA